MARIVVVDDEHQVRTVLCRLLDSRGHSTLSASSAAEAIEVMTPSQPDIVLSDIVMPGGNGIELRETVARQWPGLPVILISGHSDDGPVEYARRTPGTAFVSKPFDMVALLRMIETMSEEAREAQVVTGMSTTAHS